MQRRIHALDGLRGYAAIVVLFYHAILGYNYGGLVPILSTPIQSVSGDMIWGKCWLTALSGESAVAVFFLISGCVLTRSAAKDVETFGVVRSSLAFAVRRILRVFPAVIVCVPACAAAMAVQNWFFDIAPTGTFDAERLVRNGLLIDYDIIGPAWTLQVEMLAAPFIFIGGWMLARHGYIGPVLFLVASLVVHELPGLMNYYYPLTANLFYLALGTLIPTEIGKGSSRLAERIGAPALIVGFIFIRMFLPDGSIAMLMQAGFGYLFLCLVVYVQPAKITAFLNKSLSQFLGKVSFGFYLWNILFLNVLWGFREVYFPPVISQHAVEFGLLAGAVLLLPSLALAALSERYIEQPFIELGRSISNRILHRPVIDPLGLQVRTGR